MSNVRPLVSAADLDRRAAFTQAAKDVAHWQGVVNKAAAVVAGTKSKDSILLLDVALRELHGAKARLSSCGRLPETEEALKASLLLIATMQKNAAMAGLLDAVDVVLAAGEAERDAALAVLEKARDEHHMREKRLKAVRAEFNGGSNHG